MAEPPIDVRQVAPLELLDKLARTIDARVGLTSVNPGQLFSLEVRIGEGRWEDRELLTSIYLGRVAAAELEIQRGAEYLVDALVQRGLLPFLGA